MYQMNYKYVNDRPRLCNFNFLSINFQNGVKLKFLQQIYSKNKICPLKSSRSMSLFLFCKDKNIIKNYSNY